MRLGTVLRAAPAPIEFGSVSAEFDAERGTYRITLETAEPECFVWLDNKPVRLTADTEIEVRARPDLVARLVVSRGRRAPVQIVSVTLPPPDEPPEPPEPELPPAAPLGPNQWTLTAVEDPDEEGMWTGLIEILGEVPEAVWWTDWTTFQDDPYETVPVSGTGPGGGSLWRMTSPDEVHLRGPGQTMSNVAVRVRYAETTPSGNSTDRKAFTAIADSTEFAAITFVSAAGNSSGGQITVAVEAGDAVLQFSSAGAATQEFPAAETTIANVIELPSAGTGGAVLRVDLHRPSESGDFVVPAPPPNTHRQLVAVYRGVSLVRPARVAARGSAAGTVLQHPALEGTLGPEDWLLGAVMLRGDHDAAFDAHERIPGLFALRRVRQPASGTLLSQIRLMDTDGPFQGAEVPAEATIGTVTHSRGISCLIALPAAIEDEEPGEPDDPGGSEPDPPGDDTGLLTVAQRADNWRGMTAGQTNTDLNFGAFAGTMDGETVVTLAVSPANLTILRLAGNVQIFGGALLVALKIGDLDPVELPWDAGTGSYRATIPGYHALLGPYVSDDVAVAVEAMEPPAPPPDPEPPAGAPDVTVTTVNGILSAMAAAPSNLGRVYVIGVQPGTYGQVNVPSGYNKGSTRVEIRGLSLSNPPVIRGFEAQNSRNLIFRALRFVSIARDGYGFPSTNARGLQISDGRNIEVQNCEFLHQYIGIAAVRTKDILIQDCTFRACGMDDVRIFQDCERITFRRIHVTIYGPPNAFPLMRDSNNQIYTVNGQHFPRDIAVDLRRADKGPFTTAQSYPLANGQMSTTVWTKQQRTNRHPDGIQAAGTSGSWDEILIEDSRFEHHKPIFLMNERGREPDRNKPPPPPENKAGSALVRRCWIECEQTLGCSFAGCNDGQVSDTLIRYRSFMAPWWVGVHEARVAANGDAVLHVQNTVAPMSISNRNLRNVITSSGFVVSSTAFPTGWSGFGVANGEYGCTWRRGLVRGDP